MPMLVQMHGESGAGKSTVARALASRLGALALDKDLLKDPGHHVGLTSDVSGQFAYDALFALARDLLDQGQSVVLDSPRFWTRVEDRGREIAENLDADYVMVEVRCDDRDELARRLRDRDALHWQPTLPRDGPLPPGATEPTCSRIVVDTLAGIDACVEQVMLELQELSLNEHQPSGRTPARSALAYQRSLPAKRMGAGLLVVDGRGNVLLVEPTYKPTWEIPGGSVDADESPRECVLRETREELGFEVTPGRLLVLDYQHPEPDRTESMMFVFDGGVVDSRWAERIQLPPDELRSHRFVAPEDLSSLLSPRVARRLREALQAKSDSETVRTSAFVKQDKDRRMGPTKAFTASASVLPAKRKEHRDARHPGILRAGELPGGPALPELVATHAQVQLCHAVQNRASLVRADDVEFAAVTRRVDVALPSAQHPRGKRAHSIKNRRHGLSLHSNRIPVLDEDDGSGV